MANYPLHKLNDNSDHLYPQSSFYSDEAAERLCTLHLRSELLMGNDRKYHTAYRLRASKPHRVEDTFGYVIHCPKCHDHILKQIGRCHSSHVLGLYKCPVCDK